MPSPINDYFRDNNDERIACTMEYDKAMELPDTTVGDPFYAISERDRAMLAWVERWGAKLRDYVSPFAAHAPRP
jgi:hypothetical protein